jgi:hypothetical protein
MPPVGALISWWQVLEKSKDMKILLGFFGSPSFKKIQK